MTRTTSGCRGPAESSSAWSMCTAAAWARAARQGRRQRHPRLCRQCRRPVGRGDRADLSVANPGVVPRCRIREGRVGNAEGLQHSASMRCCMTKRPSRSLANATASRRWVRPEACPVNRSGQRSSGRMVGSTVSPDAAVKSSCKKATRCWSSPRAAADIGTPSERDRARLLEDLADGYVTPETALSAYGLDPIRATKKEAV